jgi:fumarate reductase subunit D
MANGDTWLNPLVRPIITILVTVIFFGLVVLKALGKMSVDFEQSPISQTFQTFVIVVYAAWAGERSALKVPGNSSKKTDILAAKP